MERGGREQVLEQLGLGVRTSHGIAQAIGFSQRQVLRILAELQQEGIVERELLEDDSREFERRAWGGAS